MLYRQVADLVKVVLQVNGCLISRHPHAVQLPVMCLHLGGFRKLRVFLIFGILQPAFALICGLLRFGSRLMLYKDFIMSQFLQKTLLQHLN